MKKNKIKLVKMSIYILPEDYQYIRGQAALKHTTNSALVMGLINGNISDQMKDIENKRRVALKVLDVKL